jgi:hypothetical protein
MKRCILLILVVTCGAFAATLPGYRPQDLARGAIAPADIRTLAAALSLDGDDVQQAHAAMSTYRDAMEVGAAQARAEIRANVVTGAAAHANAVTSRKAMLDAVRDQIDARQRTGEFLGDDSAMREAYEEAMADAERELSETREAGAQLPGWGDAFLAQASVLGEWYVSSDAHLQTVRAELAEIAGEERQDAFELWWLNTLLERSIKRARLAGERLDPDVPLAGLGLGDDVTLADVRQDWRESHWPLLEARDIAVRKLPEFAADAISRGNIASWRRAVERAIAAREAVRDHAWQGVQMRAVILDDVTAAAYIKASMKLAYPAITRRDRAMRVLVAAIARPDLDESQRAMTMALQLEHESLVNEIQSRHLLAILADEGQLLVDQDVVRVSTYFPGTKIERNGTPRLEASSAERKKFIADTMSRLQSILTEEQWGQLPGTRTQPVRD